MSRSFDGSAMCVDHSPTGCRRLNPPSIPRDTRRHAERSARLASTLHTGPGLTEANRHSANCCRRVFTRRGHAATGGWTSMCYRISTTISRLQSRQRDSLIPVIWGARSRAKPPADAWPPRAIAAVEASNTLRSQRRGVSRRAIWLAQHDFAPEARRSAQREGGGSCRPDCARKTRRAGRSDPHAGAALQPRLRPARGSLLPALRISDGRRAPEMPRTCRSCSGARRAPEHSLESAT